MDSRQDAPQDDTEPTPGTTEPPIVPAGDGDTPDERLTQPDQGPINLQPGPTDQGGQGGMATREQEAREERAGSGQD